MMNGSNETNGSIGTNGSSGSDISEEEEDDVIYEEEPFHGITIKAATEKKLIRLCLGYFDDEKPYDQMEKFVKVFFLTYHWYMEPQELLQYFIDILDNKDGCDEEGHLSSKVGMAVEYWLNNYGSDFENNEEAMNLLNILNTKIQNKTFNGCSLSLNLNKWNEYKVSDKTSYETTTTTKSLNFNSMSGEDLGDLFLFLNWKSLILIPIYEWRTYGKTAKTNMTPFLKEQIGLFNDVSKYVMGMVLNHNCPEKRAQSIHKFILMSKRLKEKNDYNTLLAVIGGLGHSTISRLRKTKESMSYEDKLYIKETHEVLTSDNNYTKYRSLTDDVDGFIIPILGVIMKDLVALETAVKDHVPHKNNELINFHKLVQVSNILEHIIRANSIHPDICPRKDLYNIFRVSIKSKYSEDALYELSLEREPRKDALCELLSEREPQKDSNSTSQRSSVSNTTLFADWATGVTDTVPSRETVESHVKGMVDVVFKTYDLDQNNYISKEEFDQLATNFSFIDSFAVLDVNGDGNISRQEMINYFMNANSQEMTKEFLHDFQEHSYFSPHNCVYCTGFLWGIGKVGYRCKVCQISCHKECKNRVVLECRPNRINSLRNDKSRKGIMKRIRTIDTEWKGSCELPSSQESDSGSPRTPRSAPPYTNGDVFIPNYESSAIVAKLKEQIAHLQMDNESLRKENTELKSSSEMKDNQIGVLRNQLNLVRQQSVFFMIEQMERLHSCKETDV